MRPLARNGPASTLAVFVLLWLLLDRSAAALGSTRGEAGLAVLGLVLAAAIAGECLLSRSAPGEAARALGLRLPEVRGLFWSVALSAALLLYFPVFEAVTGARIVLLPNAALLILGMFAQGGFAEELVFRGFVFRRLRAGRSFWSAAVLASAPFVAVHALLFVHLEFSVALASLLLAVSMSFPLAWLFERGGGSVVGPAILHGVVQAGIKVIEAGEHFAPLALGWIAVCAVIPWAAFFLRPRFPGIGSDPVTGTRMRS